MTVYVVMGIFNYEPEVRRVFYKASDAEKYVKERVSHYVVQAELT